MQWPAYALPRAQREILAARAGVLRNREVVMSKGMDRKKEQKKKPAKTLKEKRAAKDEKKAAKPFMPG